MRRTLLLAPLGVFLAAAPPTLGPGHTLTPRSQWTDELGQTHIRYTHRYRGLRVWGSEMVDHLGPGAAPPTLNLALSTHVSPKFQAFLASPPAEGEPVLWPDYVQVPADNGSNAELMDRDLVDYRDAFYIAAQTDPDDPGADAWDFIVDAETGEVLEQIPVQLPDQTPSQGIGNSLYQGAVTLDTTATGAGFLLQDLTRGSGGVFGFNQMTDGRYLPVLPTVYANPTDTWGNGLAEAPGVDTASPTGQTMAVDMAAGLQEVWDYFHTIHNRLGPDGLGTAVRGIAHPGNGKTDNAMWLRGNRFTFEVYQPGAYLPLTTLPILAHEVAHGVTEFTANLIYRGESGGLNEASSDIFGAMANTWVRNGSGTTIGNIGTVWDMIFYTASPGGAMTPSVQRSYIKPSSAGRGAPDAWFPDLYKEDVHAGSGPMNRAFYFLSQGSSGDPANQAYSALLPFGMGGVGNDEAARIWYRALNTYLTTPSDYADARNQVLQSALDLYGAGSPETQAVASAFAAIAVGSADTPAPLAQVPLPAQATLAGALLTLSASPAAGVTKVLFYVDGIYTGSASAPPYAVTVDSSRTLANGSHTLLAKAFSGAGLVATSADVPFTLANALQQILPDPGLEGGGRGGGWVTTEGNFSSVLSFDPTGSAPHTGFRWLKFDGSSGNANEVVAAVVTIPAGSGYASLKLWLRCESEVPTRQEEFGVKIVPNSQQPGAPASLLGVFALANQPLGVWTPVAFDLSPYAGRSVELQFLDFIQPGTGTSFNVDDVSVLCSATPPVDLTLMPNWLEVWPGTTTPTAFTAQVTGTTNASVTWTAVGGGAVDAAGNYTPPAASGTYLLQAQSNADPGAIAQAPVRVRPRLALSPAAPSLATGTSLLLNLAAAPGVAPVLALSGGPDPGTFQWQPGSTQVIYTASATPGSYTLQATDPASGATAAASLTVVYVPAMAVAPAQVNLAVGAGCQFTATVNGQTGAAVTWSVLGGDAGGSISSTGLYAAPQTAGNYVVSATSVQYPDNSFNVLVTVVNGLAINPAAATVLTGASQDFSVTAPNYGNPAVTWSILEGSAGGSNQGGSYTAPAAPGTYHMVATSTTDASLTAQATVTVKTTDLNGNGVTILDFGDLAILADAWGTLPVVSACDFNGDGVVNDEDVALFFSRFGGLPQP